MFKEYTPCLPTYLLALRPSDSLGLFSYRHLFLPVDYFVSRSLNLHLLLYFFQLSQFRSFHSSIFLPFTLKYFIKYPSLHSYYISSPFQSFIFNMCYMSRCLYSSIPD
jgi:hypothetical protein